MKYCFSLLLLFLVNVSVAQIKLEGVVKDSIGSPLELANVIAINQESQALESYGITNYEGRFKLDLKENSKYSLQVSYIGMKTHTEDVVTAKEDMYKEVTMSTDNALQAVELTYEMPVSVKGDTLVYNADSFKTGTERKLEDVLEKLPGVQINDDGQIEVEGKVVSKIMVEGKDFFDGDTKLATKNIPSNAVDKIQVLRNYSEVSQMSGVGNNQDNVAINIKLKEGKENFWFGNVTVGGGSAPDDALYLVQPKLFYYSPKASINFIGDMNNLGEPALTWRDLRGFGGGFRAPSRSSGTSINLGDNGLGFLTDQNSALQITNKLAASNFSYSPNKALNISGFGIFNSTRTLSKRITNVEYTNPDLGIPDEETTQNSTEKSDQGLLKLSLGYKPNANNQLDYDVLTRFSKDKQEQNLFSTVVLGTDQFDEVTPFSLSQNLNYYYTLNETNIFAFEVQHVLKNEDPFYNAVLVNDPNDDDAFDNTADALGFDTSFNNYDLAQDRLIKSNQLDAKLDYYNILNDKSNINFTLGTILSRQDFNSRMFQFLGDGSEFDPTPTIDNTDGEPLRSQNDTQYNFSDIYLGVHYTLKTGKFTFIPGFSAHAYGNNNIQYNDEYKDNFFRILPDFETRIDFKNSESLTFRYNMRNQFTDVTRLAEGLVMSNFNNFSYGEPELQNALSHNLSLFYRSFNLFNYTNVFARLSYNKNIDQIRSLTNFENVIRTGTFFNSPFADESFSANGRIQRTFGKIRASLSTNFDYSKSNQFVQGRQSINERFTHSYTPEIRTNFREWPNVRFRYRYSISDNNQGGNTTKFITNAPSVDFDAYILKAFTFNTEFAYNEQDRENGSPQIFRTWDASLSYRKNEDSKWEYAIKATNLLNIDSRVSNGASNISVFSSETFIQPRFVTLRLRYEI